MLCMFFSGTGVFQIQDYRFRVATGAFTMFGCFDLFWWFALCDVWKPLFNRSSSCEDGRLNVPLNRMPFWYKPRQLPQMPSIVTLLQLDLLERLLAYQRIWLIIVDACILAGLFGFSRCWDTQKLWMKRSAQHMLCERHSLQLDWWWGCKRLSTATQPLRHFSWGLGYWPLWSCEWRHGFTMWVPWVSCSTAAWGNLDSLTCRSGSRDGAGHPTGKLALRWLLSSSSRVRKCGDLPQPSSMYSHEGSVPTGPRWANPGMSKNLKEVAHSSISQTISQIDNLWQVIPTWFSVAANLRRDIHGHSRIYTLCKARSALQPGRHHFGAHLEAPPGGFLVFFVTHFQEPGRVEEPGFIDVHYCC